MKLHLGLVCFFVCVVVNISCAQQPNVTHNHSHYETYTNVPQHKLIFPSKVPDQVIINLTENPSESFAVNWRTSLEVDSAFVEIAKESHGPELRLEANKKRILATTEYSENENVSDEEPLVKAAYHSAIVEDLIPGETYVYRVGNGAKSDQTWSEWYQITMPKPEDDFSFIYFGDAQNDVKSMWSRVIRKSYKMMPEVDFMLHAGDLINHSESNREWGEWFYAGSYHATVPSVMTPGNHEYVWKKTCYLNLETTV